ncbi:MAG: dual specificity protein phosphatase family protein [bacterium]
MAQKSEQERKREHALLSLRFCWHVDGVIGGSARPGRYGNLKNDLEFLKEHGISLIVNLTAGPLDIPPDYQADMKEIHEPLPDGHPPRREQLDRIISVVENSAHQGEKVVVHCRGGIGRTATVLIPLLMTMEGISLQEAINRLRKAGRYTQSMDQWEFLKEWAKEKSPPESY